MKHLLCAAAMAAFTAGPASAAIYSYEYTMAITSITIFDGDDILSPTSATLPIGSVAVGDVGSGVFGYTDSWDAHNIGYANWGYAVTETYTIGDAPIQRFNVGSISHVSTAQNSVTLWDSYDAWNTPDSVSFNAWNDSARRLQITFTDVTASHLAGTEVTDVGNFPLEHAGTFEFQMSGPGGVFYRLNGTLLTAGVNGGPMVDLPPPGTLPVPEPETWALLLAGLGVLASGRLLRNRSQGQPRGA